VVLAYLQNLATRLRTLVGLPWSVFAAMRILRRFRAQVVIGVGGCVASQEGEGILERAPFVDVVLGPQTLHRLPELLAGRFKLLRWAPASA